eukprot:1141834-Pelagomonas_calceolata.AAC.3
MTMPACGWGPECTCGDGCTHLLQRHVRCGLHFGVGVFVHFFEAHHEMLNQTPSTTSTSCSATLLRLALWDGDLWAPL